MERPEDLPDFARPPVNELVMGIQFDRPQVYNFVFATRVWELFAEDYPSVEEHPPLGAQFETFSTTPNAPPQPRFEFGAPPHPRLWFVSDDARELLQFQSDRLLANWRQVERGDIYPRFEGLMEKFAGRVSALSGLLASLGDKLVINQAEVSYLNTIQGDGEGGFPKGEDWLNFINPIRGGVENFGASFRKVIREEGVPVARLHCEVSPGYNLDGRPILTVNLTYRGAPKQPTVEAALDLIRDGRQVIVQTFAEITTEKAHQVWQRAR